MTHPRVSCIAIAASLLGGVFVACGAESEGPSTAPPSGGVLVGGSSGGGAPGSTQVSGGGAVAASGQISTGGELGGAGTQGTGGTAPEPMGGDGNMGGAIDNTGNNAGVAGLASGGDEGMPMGTGGTPTGGSGAGTSGAAGVGMAGSSGSAGFGGADTAGGSNAAGSDGGGDDCNLPDVVSFQQDVQPFLIPSCGGGNGCHVIDDQSTMGSGGYNHAYDWITAGVHTDSCPDGGFRFEVVIDVINEANPASCQNSRKMPPPDETGDRLRTPLTVCEVATLQAWLDEPLVTQTHREDDTSPTTPYPMPPFN